MRFSVICKCECVCLCMHMYICSVYPQHMHIHNTYSFVPLLYDSAIVFMARSNNAMERRHKALAAIFCSRKLNYNSISFISFNSIYPKMQRFLIVSFYLFNLICEIFFCLLLFNETYAYLYSILLISFYIELT